jgi:(S)-2-hydroxyglutarate dehydrogenase
LKERHDVVVVGAGIIGLATARALLLERPTLRVAVVEKESQIGSHQTGHNSGVLHSGIYYAPGSLKATLCIRGKQALERYAEEHQIPISKLGKLIIATGPSELDRLAELRRRAVANGVGGLRDLGAAEITEVEPEAIGYSGLHASETAVIDYGAVARALADDVRALNGVVLLKHDVTRLSPVPRGIVVETTGGATETRNLVTCGGLQSDRLARMSGLQPPARIVPFRGDYYTLVPKAAEKIRGLIYPVPDPAFPFLGVHFTRRIDGSVLAGPNAVLSLAREGYRRASFRARDAASALAFKGTWNFARRNARMAAAEVWRDLSKQAFAADMKRYVPFVNLKDMTFGPVGIRAQAVTAAGHLVDDFLIVGGPRTMHVLNAPSPGATASLAIGDELAARAFRDLIDR